MSIAFVSVVIAVCALGVTIWQGKQNDKHNKLSVRPFLSAKLYWDAKGDTGFFTYELMNCGIGPAIIKDFILFFGDKEVSRNNDQIYRNFLNKKLEKFMEVTPVSYLPGAVMQTKEIQALITFKYNIQNQSPIDFINKLHMVIHYQSIYQDEIFIHDLRTNRQAS